MSIEQDIKMIVSLLEAIAGKKSFPASIPNSPVPPGPIEQLVDGFHGTVELPAPTTNFDDIKKNLVGMSKSNADTWYNQCIQLAKSEKQQYAITQIFKEHLA